MSKGYVKTWRCEENIAGLWENPAMFCAYQKLKILAVRPEWSVCAPWAVLAKRMKMSPNTLRAAVAGLAKIGLIRAGKTAGGITRLTLTYADEEPELNVLEGAEREADGNVQAREAAPGSVSKIDTPEKTKMSKFDTPQMSKSDTPLPLMQEVTTNKKTTPHTPQPVSGFEAFWNVYPNKKGKQRAIRRWKRGAYDAAEILPVLSRQKKLREWCKEDGRFVPRADAYLNQRRWEDALPEKEEFFILDFKNPTTERETTLRAWLEATSANLLKYDNQKINGVFESDRADFEKIVAIAGGNVQAAFAVMRHGWRKGCNSMRGIRERAAGYLDDLQRDKKL